MYSEVLQLGGMFVFFIVALILWLHIVYLPGRTLERWQDQRVQVSKEPQPPEAPPREDRGF